MNTIVSSFESIMEMKGANHVCRTTHSHSNALREVQYPAHSVLSWFKAWSGTLINRNVQYSGFLTKIVMAIHNICIRFFIFYSFINTMDSCYFLSFSSIRKYTEYIWRSLRLFFLPYVTSFLDRKWARIFLGYLPVETGICLTMRL